MLSPATILSVSMLVSCSSSRLPESSDFGDRNIKIVYTVAITVLLRACNFKRCEQSK